MTDMNGYNDKSWYFKVDDDKPYPDVTVFGLVTAVNAMTRGGLWPTSIVVKTSDV